MLNHRSLVATVAIAVLLTADPVVSDSLESAGADLCEKVKTCALAEIDKQDMTPEMREMMEPMLENMCVGMRQGMDQVPMDHQLYKPAVACMRSMANLSCTQLQDGNQVQTPECVKYQEMAMEMYREQ